MECASMSIHMALITSDWAHRIEVGALLAAAREAEEAAGCCRCCCCRSSPWPPSKHSPSCPPQSVLAYSYSRDSPQGLQL